jgi:hypothetical protein
VDELFLPAVECIGDEWCYTEIYTAEPFMPEPNASEVEVAVRKLKCYKSPGVDQIPAELIQAGGETLCSQIHKLIKLI